MHFPRRPVVAATAIALAWLAAAPAAADVKAGVEAWQAGNFEAAIREWRPLADGGDADAQFNMGQAYKLGRGVPTDLAIAQGWYEKAARQGHGPAQAILGLILFQNGQRAEAMPWITKGADHGDPRAQYILATALFNGDLVAKDWPRAYALMTRAAAQGIAPAATSLTEMDLHIPLADREKGVTLARQLERSESAAQTGAPPLASPAPPVVRVATTAPKPSPPAARPATPNAKPAATTAAAPKPKPAPTTASQASPGGKWRVQLGAFDSPETARRQWGTLSKKIGALAGMQPFYEAHGAFTRLRVGPLADRASANRLCAAAKAAGQACFPVGP
jgi:TPR repeat protein